MPRYNVYRETNCRERYSVDADTPQAAIASIEAGDEQLMDDDVTSAGGYTVVDRATGQDVTPADDDFNMHEFICKVGADARVYTDFAIEARDPDSALDKLKELLAGEPLDTMTFDADEIQVTSDNPTIIYIRDEEGNDHHELVDLEPDDGTGNGLPAAPAPVPNVGFTMPELRALVAGISELRDSFDRGDIPDDSDTVDLLNGDDRDGLRNFDPLLKKLLSLAPNPAPVNDEKAYAHTPETCPSKHSNPGNDVCADCGEDLNPPVAGADKHGEDVPAYSLLIEFVQNIAALSTPQEEWAPPETCTYQGLEDPTVDACPDDGTYAAGLSHDRLCGEYEAFMKIVRQARHIIVDPETAEAPHA